MTFEDVVAVLERTFELELKVAEEGYAGSLMQV